MKIYLLAISFNICLLALLFLIGSNQRNDYGIFFELSLAVATILYGLGFLFVLLNLLIYKKYERGIATFVLTFCVLASVILIFKFGRGMSSFYYSLLVPNMCIVVCIFLMNIFSRKKV